MRLVVDMGGTNTRLAIAQNGNIDLETIQRFHNDDYPTPEAVIDDYLRQHSSASVSECVIAIAGSVQHNSGRLTNRDWIIKAETINKKLQIQNTTVINDLAALGYAVPHLRADQLTTISDAKPVQNRPALVVGIGTGFNVCPVLQVQDSVLCPHVEAGHISLPMSLADALENKNINPRDFPSIESLLSGRGFSAYCKKILKNQNIEGKDILNDFGHTKIADEIINSYAALIGWILRDLTLAYMPLGGIYCAGGIARHILARAAEECCSVLIPRHETISLNIPPVRFIKDDFAALYGCAKACSHERNLTSATDPE